MMLVKEQYEIDRELEESNQWYFGITSNLYAIASTLRLSMPYKIFIFLKGCSHFDHFANTCP